MKTISIQTAPGISLSLLAVIFSAMLTGCSTTEYGGGPTVITDQEVEAGRETAQRLVARAQTELAAQEAKLAQSDDAEHAGVAAEKAGRFDEAFQQDLSALQALGEDPDPAEDYRLCERIIKLVPRLSRTPPIPEEVKRRMAFGKVALKEAQKPQDFEKSAAEFAKASHLAPWLAAPYFNLALVQEKAGLVGGALNHFKLYLLASPNDPDAEKVRGHIYELEYKQGGTASAPQGLAGNWAYGYVFNGEKKKLIYRIDVSGDDFTLVRPAAPYSSQATMYTGTLQGRRIRGKYTQGQALNCGETRRDVMRADFYLDNIVHCTFPNDFALPMSGELSSDGDTLRLSYETAVTTVAVHSRTDINLLAGNSSETVVTIGLMEELKLETIKLTRDGPAPSALEGIIRRLKVDQ